MPAGRPLVRQADQPAAERPPTGRFYGGWVTGQIVGPFKGEPGSFG